MAFSREKMMSSLFLLTIMLISLMFSTYQEGITEEQEPEPRNTKIPKVQSPRERFPTGSEDLKQSTPAVLNLHRYKIHQ